MKRQAQALLLFLFFSLLEKNMYRKLSIKLSTELKKLESRRFSSNGPKTATFVSMLRKLKEKNCLFLNKVL